MNRGGESDWSFVYERAVVRGAQPKVSWIADLPIPYKDFDQWLFSGSTLHSVTFAARKQLETIWQLGSRAIVYEDLNYDGIAHVLYTEARRLAFKQGVTENILRNAVAAVLRLRFKHSDSVLVEDAIGKVLPLFDLPDNGLRDVLATHDLGGHKKRALEAYRIALRGLIASLGIPQSFGFLDSSVERISSS